MVVKKLIVYFHGYGSSANTSKLQKLEAVENSRVFAWDIDIDPSVSIPELLKNIDDTVMLERLHEPCQVVFVGTSLGGWYASTVADIYGVDAVLINPSWHPAKGLSQKYGVDEKIAEKYTEISWNKKYKYFIAKNDEVIDFSPVHDKLIEVNAEFVDNAGHRFSGVEFQRVVDHINNLPS